MTLTDINKALSVLVEQPTRENVLAFSFALMQWMNIAPNGDEKPQLLSPQTQKLKEYLVTAPQTVQPQLYRLSADGQNIRVRFAVLKKLKKEYISQLVDNDPGLGSYQSFSKGLIPSANGTGFIPTQPYFIHFVATPEYNRLILIFNQGEQKRIVSFRKRLTNTQYHKIILAWQGIGEKSKPEIADLFWKSLDIKEVNKEFYRQIKERFDALLGIVKAQHSAATENQVKQFTVRMIGRYIFCWFLKEKEIIPISLINKQNIQNTDNYYQTVLLKLFFETLNTKVQDRDPLKHNALFEKIPYLNGGLFDENDEDKLFAKLNLDAWLLPFVEILESYDFTVDESSSQYQQVAVDPEMLGRIFENLLASQNEETEKLANQRKAFGAFYTPREIVDYMVNESVKAYLQTQWEQNIVNERTKQLNNPEQVGDIFGNKKPQQLVIETKRYELKEEEKQKIEKMLSPLFSAFPNPDGLKKEEKNLLLSFLEQIKILDPACGSGAFPMGVLHKLVELHEVLGTVKSSYELKKDILSQNIYGVDIMPMAIEIARLRAWLSLILEEDYKPNDPKHNFGLKPLPNLDFKFICANSLIDLGLDAFIRDSKGTVHETFTQKLVKDLKDLENLRTNFFNPSLASNQKEHLKLEYFVKLEKVVADIEEAHDIVLKQIAQKIKNWNPFDDSYASPFFSPTWMFGIDKGFDVVIGNPPYGAQLSREDTLLFKKTYDLKTSETAILFIERGKRILKNTGVQTYIVPKSLTFASNYNSTRDYIERGLSAIVDCGKAFEEVNLEACIFQFKNGVQLPSYSSLKFTDKSTFEKLSEIDKVLINEFGFFPNGLLKSEIELGQKISKIGLFLKDVATNSRGCLLQDNLKDKGEIKVIGGKEIDRYGIRGIKGFISNEEKILDKCTIKHNSILAQNIVAHLTNPIDHIKIIGCLPDSNNNFVITDTINQISIQDDEYSREVIWALFSSTLINWYVYFFIYGKAIRTMHFDNNATDRIPIPQVSENNPLTKRVQKVLALKKNNQVIVSLEKEIDVLVYKLYELTYEEVKIVDKDFWLSDEEYEKIKLE
jgi:hypothetical protein